MAARRTTTPRETRAVTPPNVVPIRGVAHNADDIVRDVMEQQNRRTADITRQLNEATAALHQLKRERARDLLPIGCAMDRTTLDNFIEIGQRMLAARGRR